MKMQNFCNQYKGMVDMLRNFRRPKMVGTAKKAGVTLIELLIVVLILAALAAIAIPRISQSAQNAKVNACLTTIEVINSLAEMYNAETGSFPATLTVITQDTAFFPEGEPICPLTGASYPNVLVNGRLDVATHLAAH